MNPQISFNNLNLFHFLFLVETTSEDSQPSESSRRRKKVKAQEILEDTTVTSEYAKQLDLSCMGTTIVKAPNIENAYILKYNRRKKDGHIFLTVFYECEEEYELESPEKDRLHCSKENWVGEHPVCVLIPNDDEDEGGKFSFSI